MVMTRKDFNAIADALNKIYHLDSTLHSSKHEPDSKDSFISMLKVVTWLGSEFKHNNPRFDIERWVAACYKTTGEQLAKKVKKKVEAQAESESQH